MLLVVSGAVSGAISSAVSRAVCAPGAISSTVLDDVSALFRALPSGISSEVSSAK